MTQPTPFRITADEVNCLIHAYFQDSGEQHWPLPRDLVAHVAQASSTVHLFYVPRVA